MERNEISMVSYFDSHWYRIKEGDSIMYYPSATTKLGVVAKPFLAKWRGDIGNREADMRVFEAQQRGTRIHSAWEILCNGGIAVYNPPQNPQFIPEEIEKLKEEHRGLVEIMRHQDEMIDVWKLSKFMEEVKPTVVASEMKVVSHKYQEAGTADTIFEIKEGHYKVNGITPLHIPKGRYVADLKTGNVVGDEAYMQTACYANALEEMGLGPIDGTLILHTGSKNKRGIQGFGVTLRTTEEMKQDFKDFRNVSALWERKNKDARPTVFEFPNMIKLEGVNQNGKQDRGLGDVHQEQSTVH